uniref:Uncharacterized protein n=1 Tax=Faecalibaculum rodentium TaxID=1702221 RepID=A0A140DRG9_9FIRM|nr:hypothetical protein AALO17_01120 [Faecalibaculum rodentium]
MAGIGLHLEHNMKQNPDFLHFFGHASFLTRVKVYNEGA